MTPSPEHGEIPFFRLRMRRCGETVSAHFLEAGRRRAFWMGKDFRFRMMLTSTVT
jgi:hypothetical protein